MALGLRAGDRGAPDQGQRDGEAPAVAGPLSSPGGRILVCGQPLQGLRRQPRQERDERGARRVLLRPGEGAQRQGLQGPGNFQVQRLRLRHLLLRRRRGGRHRIGEQRCECLLPPSLPSPIVSPSLFGAELCC